MSGKFALIIGNTEYTDPGLAQLTAPGKDAEDFARVLKDHDICAFDDVNILLNQPEYVVREAIDDFFNQKRPDDLLILYFSGHGVRDELGALYLAVKNTSRTKLRATGIKSDYIREVMDQSRSKRQVLILDCCNSGAYAQGTKAATGVSIGTASAFEGTGYGRVVLTASDSTQFAWEGEKVIGETDNSLFTHFLVKGLEGEADNDGDGRITIDELYDYAYDQIVNITPKQTPGKWSYKQQGEIVLRQNMRVDDIKPMPLPIYLANAIENPDPDVRFGAVQSLTKLLTGKNIGLARSARDALERIEAEDDSRRVSQAATQVLESIRRAEQKAQEEQKAREEAEHQAMLKAEEERKAKEESQRLLAEQKTEEDRRAKKEAERLATLKAEEERIVHEKVEAERKAKEEAEKLLQARAKLEAVEREATERAAIHLKAERNAAREKTEREVMELAALRRPEREAKEKVAVRARKATKLPWITLGAIGGGIIALILCGIAAIAFFSTRFGTAAIPTPTEPPATPEPLAPAYIPPKCQNFALATIPPATALVQPTPQANPEISKDLQQKVFDDVVNVIKEVYIYPDFNGNDWPAIVSKYQAKIDAGLDKESFYSEMKSMITDLGDEKSFFQSPADVAKSNAQVVAKDFVGVGILVYLDQLDKNQIPILSVFPNSPAEYGGLKAHDIILAVDGLPFVDNGESFDYIPAGPECSAIVLTVKSPGEEPRDVMLIRQRIQSRSLIDARLVPTTDGSRIGYIFIPDFFDETIPQQIEDALNNFGPLDGLILDNRWSGGGNWDVVEPILAFFTSGNLGQFVSRKDSRPLQISANPIQNSQDVSLIVLVSEKTESSGEIFAGVLRDSARAKIVGATSPGNIEILSGYSFDDGSELWIAEETFDPSVSHANWEQSGIVPDVEVHADWDTIIFETDPSVAAALSLLGHK